jgi:hypothetical protein
MPLQPWRENNMIKRFLIIFSLAVAILAGAAAAPARAQASAAAPEQTYSQTANDSLACPICGIDLSKYSGLLTAGEVQGLLRALNDEYHAYAVYGTVIRNLGAVRPFTNVQVSEARHISSLVTLFKRYGVLVPANPWTGVAVTAATVQQACALGTSAEIDNVALYDGLFASTSRSDILTVYRALRSTSQTQHLLSFQRCA